MEFLAVRPVIFAIHFELGSAPYAATGWVSQPKYLTRSKADSLEGGGERSDRQHHGKTFVGRTKAGVVKNWRNYLLYRKIARATKATVMIHRMTSLLPFFSSAIGEVQHTCDCRSSVVITAAENVVYGLDAVLVEPVRL
jgi:hypothetical protein